MKRATIYLYTVYDHMNFMNLVDCLSGLIGCWQCLLDQAYFQLLHKTVHRWKFWAKTLEHHWQYDKYNAKILETSSELI